MAAPKGSPQEVFSCLKRLFSPENRKPELNTNESQLILFAEHVLQEDSSQWQLACEIVDFYLSLNPPTNQFLIRAHICRAIALSYEEGKEQDCLRSFVKAINLAKKSPCYYFLVYNVSVCLWRSAVRCVRFPAQLYSSTLQYVIKALEEIKDTDYQWRLTLLLCLVQSQFNQFDDAVKSGQTALSLSRTHLPDLLLQTYRQLAGWGVVSEAKEKDLKGRPELTILIRLWKIRNSSSSDNKTRLQRLLLLATQGDTAAGKKATPPLPAHVLGGVLVELGEIALQCSCREIAQNCIKLIASGSIESKELLIRKQLLEGQLLLVSNDDYSPSSVQLRRDTLQTIGHMLRSCTEEGENTLNGSLVEQICLVGWNISLPLLQPSLRQCLLEPMTAISDALGYIDSLLQGLRVMVHLELIKINTDENHIETALQHIESARGLDTEGSYSEYLNWFEHCLKLRQNLYQTPNSSIDQAIQTLEQVWAIILINCSVSLCVQLKSVNISESIEPLLIQIGDLLTNHIFSALLNTTDTDKTSRIKLYRERITSDSSTDDDSDKTRCWLWSEVATLARKNALWDICTLACLYTVQYDDKRWSYTPTHQANAITGVPSRRSKESRSKSSHSMTPDHVSSTQSLSYLPYTVLPPVSQQKELLIELAQMYCIYAEALVYTLNSEGLAVGASPEHMLSTNETGTAYCQWVTSLTNEVHQSYLRAAEIGNELQEAWLVYNSAVYLWNYHRDILQQQSAAAIGLVSVLKPLHQYLQAIQSQNVTELSCHIGAVLVKGLVSKWTPVPSPRVVSSVQKRSTGRASAAKGKNKKEVTNAVDPEAAADLKDALTISESLFTQLTSNISLSVRYPLLRAWVLAKFLSLSPLPSNLLPFDIEDDPYTEQCRAVVAVEMNRLMAQFSFYDFPNCPSLVDTESMISSLEWTESAGPLLLELYAQLAGAAATYKNNEVVRGCCQKALELEGNNLLLSMISCLLGQYTTDKHTAIDCYKNSSRFACKASSYERIMEAVRHSWNTCLPLLVQEQERERLLAPYKEMISDVMHLAGRRVETQPVVMNEEELKLISDMYRVIFQIYTDKGEWAEALEMVEMALWVCPKSMHQILMKYKILFKSQLGVAVEGEMLRYQEEAESTILASLWYEIGLNSKGEKQRICFEKAMELLSEQEEDNHQLRIQCTLELARWLYHNGCPYKEVLNQLRSGAELCSIDSIEELDQLMQFHVMMSQCSGLLEDSLKGVACVLKIMTGLVGERPMEEWTELILSDEQISQINEGVSSETIPSSKNILKPLLTVHYLELLVDDLTLQSLHLFALPVLQFHSLIAKYIIGNETLHSFSLLKLGVVCQELSLKGPLINGSINYHDTINIRVNAMMDPFPVDSSIVRDSVLVWQVWVKMAHVLLSQGYVQESRELLAEAKSLCVVYKDEQTLAEVLLGEAKLLVFEKKFDKVLERLTEAQELSSLCWVWLEMIACTTSVISEEKAQLRQFLNRALVTAQSVLRERHLEIVTAVLTVKLELVQDTIDTCHMQSAIDALINCGGGSTVAVDTLLSLVDRNEPIQSIVWARQAVVILGNRYEQVVKLTQPGKGVVLPVQRRLIEAQLILADLLLSVIEEIVKRKSTVKNELMEKSSIEKMIDDFVRESPQLTDTEQRWEDIAKIAATDGLSIFSSCYCMSEAIPSLQTQCVGVVGLFLAEISNELAPDVMDSWLPWLPGKPLREMSSLSILMRGSEAKTAKELESKSLAQLTASVECLMTTVSRALKSQQLDIVKRAALKLFDIFGSFDPLIASAYLSLYQSCVASMSLSRLLNNCISLPEQSQLSTLLQQCHALQPHLPVSQAALSNLQKDYECWRRLSVTSNHLDYLKSFHCDTRLLIFQHSCTDNPASLYCGYLIPPQPPPPTAKKGQPPIDYDPLVPAVGYCHVSPDDLSALKQSMKQFVRDISIACRQNKMDEGIEGMLQTQFEGIVTGLEVYLDKSVAFLSTALEKEDPNKELTIILLIDEQLAELPIEALPFLRKIKIKSLSRDFSLQLLHHKLQGMKNEDETIDEDKKKQSSAEKYQVQPSSILANSTNFKYVIDPRDDLKCSVCEEIKLSMNEYPKLTSKWLGHCGTDHSLSCGEWSPLLLNASGLLVFCSEKFLSHYPPQYLSPLNLSNVSFSCIIDLLSSKDSFQFQSRLDTQKSNEEKALEEPLVLVRLLSLIGVNCVYCHQWAETVNDGMSRFKTILKNILSKPSMTGQLCQLDSSNNEDSTNGSCQLYHLFNGVVYGLPHITFVPDN